MGVFMQTQKGFTLIELMLTLTILSIALAVAVPSFNSQIQNNRSQALGEELSVALQFARSEAVKRGRAVTVCASNADHSACSNDSSTWANGWLVLLDDADDAAAAITAGEVLKVWDDLPANAAVAVQRTTSPTADGDATSFVRYTGAGVLARINNAARLVRLSAYAEGCKNNSRQELTVGIAGMVNISRASCSTES